MATYTAVLSSIDSAFNSEEWKSTGFLAFPANYWPHTMPDEFVIYEVVPSSPPIAEYQKPKYKGGLIIVQIYTRSNKGPFKVMEVADVLSDLLENKLQHATQLQDGVLSVKGIDKDDTSLFRADYSLQFNSF